MRTYLLGFSPLLFLIFINDLIKELKDSGIGVTVGKVTLNNLVFADDIVLITDTGAELQTLLTIAEKYALKWRFVFNTKKCKVMVFNGRKAEGNVKALLDGDRLEVVKEYKYLGVWFDSKLNWKLQKDTVKKKATKRAYMIVGFGAYKLLPGNSCIHLWEGMGRGFVGRSRKTAKRSGQTNPGSAE